MKNILLFIAFISAVAFGGSWLLVKVNAPPVGTALQNFDPTVGITLNGGAVQSALDQVSGTLLASQSDADKRPTITQFGDNAADIFLFDGVDDRLEFTVPATSTTFTVGFFIVPDVQSVSMAIGGTVTTSQAPLLEWGIPSATRFCVLLSPAGVSAQGSAIQNITSGTPIVMGMIYNGSVLRTIKASGGANSAGNSTVASVKLSAGDTFYIGGAPGHTSFSGMMGNIRVWYGATSTTGVAELSSTLYTDMQSRYGF